MFKSTGFISKLKVCSATLVLAMISADGFCKAGGFPTIHKSGIDPEKVPEKVSPVIPEDSCAILLDEITVSSGMKNRKTSPLRLVDIDEKTIGMVSAGRTYPELLKNIPGIYATSESGSYGDAKINIRGYKQENISVMLNGIPISGLTSGNMFWNNWMGLSDATANIQVQKGVGGSMLSDNSVGGTINIITHSPGTSAHYGAGYSYTGGGTSKAYINYNSGELNRGWGISIMGSYVWGSSWAECTDVRSWSYMASISKKINPHHSLLFTAMGSPEKHQQRSSRMTYGEMEEYGRAHNSNWGWYTHPDGTKEARTISRNNYHKPYFTLSHFYNAEVGAARRKFTMHNAIYSALADGGGYWVESKGRRLISYQKDGHLDWDAVVEENRSIAQPADRATEEGSARNIMSDFIAGHTQIGAKSSFELEMNERTAIQGGVHYQGFYTWEREQITDLLGGNYWWEDYEHNSLAGAAGRNPVKKVGDYIRTNGGKNINYGTVYFGATYKDEHWNAEAGASLNISTSRRWDKYNYRDGDIFSDRAKGVGASVKGGVLYKFNSKGRTSNSLYLNAAYYSRVPYSGTFFASGNNQISKDVKNEQNFMGELGYRLVYDRGGVEGTFYATYWKDKTLMSNRYKVAESDATKYMIKGLDAVHIGFEIDAYHKFSNWGKLSAYASFGHWEWKNDVSATIYDNYSSQVIDEIKVYSDGLPVGDAPQTQIGAAFDIDILKACGLRNGQELMFTADWQFNDRYWADFNPTTRTDENDRSEPYRIPSYHMVNLALNYRIPFSYRASDRGGSVALFVNLRNLLDEYYIERGKDGKDHTKKTFTGYWGEGRNVNFGIRINL